MNTLDLYLNNIWKETIKKIKDSNQVPETVITYFDSKLISLDDNVAIIEVPAFINFSVMNQHIDVIEKCLSEVMEGSFKVVIRERKEEIIVPVSAYNIDYAPRKIDANQTFANFVVGRSNSQAHVASLTCATNPGSMYNPLFIYGPSGLGKTHLLNAIGNHIKSMQPTKNIVFISGLEFVEGVHKANIENKYDEFKQFFHNVDVLLVDDIQFIANKPKTHEIFFTVFNDLVNNKKQICITSDRTPDEIKGLEERIISRFKQGLNVSVEAPEYETSINILKMKIASSSYSSSLEIDDDVLSFLATNFSQDVRSLEGAVNRLLFYSINFPIDNDNNHITLQLANAAFNSQFKENKNELNISTIRKVVCDYYSLTKNQICSANRVNTISNPRQIAMYLCRKLLDATYDDIGSEFGGRDHSTVINAINKVEKKIKTDSLYLKVINELESKLK